MSKQKPISPAGSVPAGLQLKENLNARVERYIQSKYAFRYNEVTGIIEFKSLADKKYSAISDYATNSIVREMVQIDIKCTARMLGNILLSDFTPIYNPFITYFNELPVWDGSTDYITQLAQTVKTTDDTLWHICFRKWLVALVGSALQDNIINHTVIVFSGEQGLGKTTWVLRLLPNQLKQYCYSGTINPNNKDTLINLSETLLINMDELENLNRTEVGTLKELITKASIRIRRPYGINSENIPRRASFAGSVNGKEFLSDTTGNRRFLCFEVTAIDNKHSVILDKAYAQAFSLFRSGFQFWFDRTETNMINNNNEQFRTLAIEEELLLTYFESCTVDQADYFFSATDVLAWLGQRTKVSLTDGSKNKMGKALKACGFIRVKRQDRYMYALKLKCYVPDQLSEGLSTQNLVDGLFG